MENEKEACCSKTKSRLEAISENSIDDGNIQVVDNIIGKHIRKSLQDKAKSMHITVKFLYSSDLDGWYDDKSRTMYLALDHAIQSPILKCFERELNVNKLQILHKESPIDAKRTTSVKKSLTSRSLICIFAVICIAGLIYGAFSADNYGCIMRNIVFGLQAILLLLIIIEIVTYKDFDYPIVLKKKEDASTPLLGTINNCGGMMDFDRIDPSSGWGVYRNYLAFWGLPIIFLGSYLAKETNTHTWRKKSYKVLGQINTSWREIYHFYIIRYGSLFVIIMLIWAGYSIGTWLNIWN